MSSEALPAEPAWTWSLSGDAGRRLTEQGFSLLSPTAFAAEVGIEAGVLADWKPYWDDLREDQYLRDGGRYRRRRHGSFIHDRSGAAPRLQPVPHRPHWQSTDYNALHGGIDRWFEPIDEGLLADPRWTQLLVRLGERFAAVAGGEVPRWYVEAHPFRIDAADGVGRPTPEGAHRDGVDFVAVILIERHQVRGGETRVFEAEGPHGMRFVIDGAWSALLLDDARVIHETTPIQPDGHHPYRDTLVITWRRQGFQAA